MSDLVLIDGNNFCHRAFWAYHRLSKGSPVSLLYGFFKTLISLKKKYRYHKFLIAWDGGYDRRLKESQEALDKGLIDSVYKQFRVGSNSSEEVRDLYDQIDLLKDIIEHIRLMQVRFQGYEADDVICSYVNKYKTSGRIVIISSDKDYYQLIDDRVLMYNPIDKEEWTMQRFRMKYGFDPYLWVDAGALMGESKDRDNIHGIQGWGEKTATKYVRLYGSIDNIINHLQKQHKLSKTEQKVLDNIEKLRLAKSLKKMDNIQNIPDIYYKKWYDKSKVENFFKQYGLKGMHRDSWRLVVK